MLAYDNFPANSRIWIYQSNRALTPEQTNYANQRLEQFVNQWLSHGKRVHAWAALLHQHFLVLMANENIEAPSGCAIDSSVALVKELEQKFSVDFFDRMTFTYVQKDGSVTTADRNTFAALYAKKEIGEDTIVFNNLVATKMDFENAWKIPLKESWHVNMV